jgi:hypothetical protein
VPGAELALGDRHVLGAHAPQLALVGALGPAVRVPALPGAERRLAVERAAARDGEVALAVGVDERRVVEALGPLPARQDHGQVRRRVRAEADRGVRRQVEVDEAAQVDRAGEEHALRHEHPPAARPVAGGNGAAEGLGAVGDPIPDRAEARDRERAAGEDRRAHAAQDVGHLVPRIGIYCSGGCYAAERRTAHDEPAEADQVPSRKP